MMDELDQLVSNIDIDRDKEIINQLIQDYNPFIINVISKLKNQYIQIENDESYSIALMAFVEAIERYDMNQGPFLPYCKLVILSRVKNHIKKEKRYEHVSIDAMTAELAATVEEDESTNLREEILQFESELKKFGIDFNRLVVSSPKHMDTKETVSHIAQKIYEDPDIMNFIYEKRRLPISRVAEAYFVSVKTIKSYKHYIIALVIIYKENLKEIKEWINFAK